MPLEKEKKTTHHPTGILTVQRDVSHTLVTENSFANIHSYRASDTPVLAMNCKFYKSKQVLCKSVQNRNYGIFIFYFLHYIRGNITGAWDKLESSMHKIQTFLKAETPNILNTAGNGKRQRPLKIRDIQFQSVFYSH